MPGGRPRKPSRLRILEGGRGKSRPLTKDLEAPKSPLVPPARLSTAERAEWKRHAGWVRGMGIESMVDAGQFEGMVRALCRARQADKSLAKGRLTMATKANGVVQRPEVSISERCWTHYERLASKFGLDPQARAKLGTDQVKPESASDMPAELQDAAGG